MRKYRLRSKNQQDLTNLLNDEYNIFNFTLIGDLTYHNFLVLHYNDDWYYYNHILILLKIINHHYI